MISYGLRITMTPVYSFIDNLLETVLHIKDVGLTFQINLNSNLLIGSISCKTLKAFYVVRRQFFELQN